MDFPEIAMRSNRFLLGVAVAAAIILPQAAWAAAKPVRTTAVVLETLQQRAQVTGTLRAVSRAVIAAQEEGAITTVHVEEGAAVGRGEVLAVTDTRRLKARLSELEADLESARAARQERMAEARFAKSDFEALANSYKRKAVSEQEYRRARAAHEVASAKVSAAAETIQSIRSRIEHLQVQIEDATIRAPFDARVVQQHAEPGEWVRPGDPIVTLVSTGRVEAWLEVPERHIARLAGSVETITLKTAGAAATRQSTSARVVPQIDERVRTFALVAELEDRDGTLVPGMSVTAWVPTAAASAFLTVPKDAIIRRDGATYVYRVVQTGDGEQADQRPVQVLFHFGNRVALATGNALKQSDRVIVEGNERLLPGDTVAAVSIDKESDDNKSTPGLEEQDQGDELARATGQERRTTVNN